MKKNNNKKQEENKFELVQFQEKRVEFDFELALSVISVSV